MGSTTSLSEERASCGLCTKSFDYKKALEILKNSLNQYEDTLQKSIKQSKQKDEKVIRQDFNQVKQQAFNYIKNDQQYKAKKLLTDFFNQQKQPKLITREIDFLDNKYKMLHKLRKNIENSVKPYKAQEKRKQIIEYDRQLQRIKDLDFNPHQDQKSGDSGDIQSYIDRIMDELKSKIIPAPKAQIIIPQKQQKASPIIPQPVIIREPTGEQYRQKFLRKLRQFNKKNGQIFRRLTKQQTEFFKHSLGIELTQGELSNIMRTNRQGIERSEMRLSRTERGYYLNCNGFELFDMQELIKSDLPMVQVLDVQQCGISSHWWKIFTTHQSRSLPNLKVVYFGLNQITQVTLNELQSLHGVQYLSFGWWSTSFLQLYIDESNQLTSSSKHAIEQFQSRHPEIKIEFPMQ